MPPYRRRSAPRTPPASAISAPGTPSSGRGTKGELVNGQWMCDCKPRRQAISLETKKPGPNKGRWFYTCPQQRRRRCKFFLWEDYAGVIGGAGPATAGAAGSQGMPRPTYRTSIGQRTTPPEERFGGPVHSAARAPATAPRPASMQQQPLPSPRQVSQSAGAGRQRIFTAPLHGAGPNDEMMRDGDYTSDEEEAPPTPTPARTRRLSSHATQGMPRPSRSATRAATRSASGSEPEETTNKITKYFGNIKKSQASSDVKQEKQSQSPPPERGPDPASAVKAAPRSGPFAEDTSDGEFDEEFDSDIDRGMVALADASEHQLQRTKSNASIDLSGDAVPIKQDPDHDGMGIDIEDAEGAEGLGGDTARQLIVPVLSASDSMSSTPRATRITKPASRATRERETRSGSDRRRRGLLVALNGSTAMASAASIAEPGPGPESSFAALFNGGRSQPQLQPVQPVQQQPMPSFSFSSSALAPSQASTVSLSQVPDLTKSFATVATSPPSSFRAGARDAGDAEGTKRKPDHERTVAWYDSDGGSDSQGASSDEQGLIRGIVQTEDPFNSSPSKRVRFGGVAADKGKEVVRSASSQSLSQSFSQSPSQGRDHNVTRAVLQLLEGQPVETRVLQQVRALLNISFEDYP